MKKDDEGLVYSMIVCERPEEAAGFVAALSRWIDSPAAFERGRARGPVEIWAAPPADNGSVTLFLSELALLAARAAFSPVPVTGTSSGDARPREARLVLDGSGRAMGLDEAQKGMPGARHTFGAST